MSDHDEERTTGHRSEEVDVVPLRQERSWWAWILLLLGPVTWATHFLVVYLLVEALCSPAAATGPGTWLGALTPVSATIAATITAGLVIAGGAAFTAHRYRQAIAEADLQHDGATDIDHQLVRDREVLFIGLLLAPLSLVAVLVVGLPALWVPVC